MKNQLFSACIFATTLISVACGPTSKKGAWTESDKKMANDLCIKEMDKAKASADYKALEGFGVNLSEFSKKVCDCSVKKMETDFDSPTATGIDKTATDIVTKIGEECAKDYITPLVEAATKKAMGDALKVPTDSTKK